MKNSTPKTTAPIQTSKRISNFERADAFEFAKARAQFFTDVLPMLYSKKCDKSVRKMIRNLKSEDDFEYVKSDALFEQVCADVLSAKFKTIQRAEAAGFTNACGYDVLDTTTGIYLEMKEIAVSQRGGANPVLSAMVSNMKNKFCTTIVLVIDPYLEGEKHYQLYAIPPHAVADDASDSIGIPHHKIDRSGKYELVEQSENIGGSYAAYKINALSELLGEEQLMRNVNVKKLVKVLRTLRGKGATATQVEELTHLDVLFANCTKNNTKKKVAKGARQITADITDKTYTIKKGAERIFFDGDRLEFVAAGECEE